MKPLLALVAVFVGIVYYCHQYYPVLTMLVAVLVLAGAGVWCVRDSGGRSGSYLPIDACGEFPEDGADHEGAHIAVAEELGVRVVGARVNNYTGITRMPGWLDDPWKGAVIAAAGAAGENIGRFTDVGLNGSKSKAGTDKYLVYQLTKRIATERGVPQDQVIREVRAEAARLVRKNRSTWNRARNSLKNTGQYGNASGIKL